MDKNIANEAGLLQASINGNSAAFESIVRKYQNLVCAITYSATSSVEKSEELAQETFVQAWKNLKQLRDLSSFKSWLCSIAKTIVKNHFKSQKRDLLRNAGSLDNAAAEPSDIADPADKLISMEEQTVVAKALQQIPESYRQPLILFYRQEKSVKQVAEMLELSEENIRTRLSRGRKMLKQQVVAMVEKTLASTAPGKAFTVAVMASVAATIIKTSAVAAAADIAATTSATGTASSAATVISAITAKIITAAAVIVIGVTAVVTYTQITKPNQTPPSAPPAIAAEKEQDTNPINAQNKTAENATSQTAQIPDKTITPPVADIVDNPPIQPEETKPPAITTPPVLVAKDEYKFVPKGVLSGLITDVNSLEPIKGVPLRICSYDYVEQYVVKTDANGVYFFENIKKDGSYTIRLETNEYITPDPWKRPRESVQLAKSTQFVKHFQLRKGARVNIDVVDEQGNPIKSVGLYAAYVSDEMGRGPKDNIRSDKKGNAFIGGLKPAEYMISAWHRDYAMAGQKVVFEQFNEIKTIVFEMKAGVSVEGIAICSDGLAACGWEVYAKPTWWHSIYCALDYPIEEDGSFILKHVLPGDYQVGINIPRGDGSTGLWSTKMELPPEDALIALDIPKLSPHGRVSISGTLELLGGEMERGIWITAIDDSRNFGTIYIRKGQKDFTIENLIPGLYKIDFNISGTTKTFRNIKAPSEGLV
ncbi:MAG: sigma-70 family RNA polymerase sigma factor, partial [Planctomycetes bacterium]|nr:sigma-70 family RNA polymerase sigma factor [Planctomycetota bacterium]